MKNNSFLAALIATICLGSSAAASAADYYLVVPVKGRQAAPGVEAINVSLAGYVLPQAQVGVPYVGFDFKPLLSVKGDANFTGHGVTWSVASGSLPAGMTLSTTGILSGTPTAPGASTVSLRAEYKSKGGTNAYEVIVADAIVLALASAVPDQALVGQTYRYDLKKLLTVTGDNAYTGTGVTWTAVSNTLPVGLTLNADGVIAGIPSAGASGLIMVRAAYRGTAREQSYQVTALDIRMSVSEVISKQIRKRVGFAHEINLRDYIIVAGDNSYDYTKLKWAVVSGSLPTGLSHLGDTGVISGTPEKSEATSVTLRATYRGISADLPLEIIAYSLEDAVPNAIDSGYGDGNGDGTLDSHQANVHSFQTVVPGTPYATIEVAPGHILSNFVAGPAPSGLPRNVKLPLGSLDYVVENVVPGGTVQAALYAPTEMRVNGHYMTNLQGVWVNLGTSVTIVGSKTKITFELTDGGPFDRDGAVNGRIVVD